MIKSFAHAAFNDVRQGDGPQHVAVIRHQQWCAPAIRYFTDDLFHFGRHNLASFSDIFLEGLRYALAHFVAIQVPPTHSRLPRKRNACRTFWRPVPSPTATLSP